MIKCCIFHSQQNYIKPIIIIIIIKLLYFTLSSQRNDETINSKI